MTFVETYAIENEISFRMAVEDFLSREFQGKQWRSNWWHPFTVGPSSSYGDRLFREFQVRCWEPPLPSDSTSYGASGGRGDSL